MNALWWLNEEATWPKCVHIQSWLIRLPMTVKISWKKAKQRTSDECYSALTSSGVQDWTEKQGHQSKGLKLFYPKRILKKECGLVHPRHIKTQMSMPLQPDDLKEKRNYLKSWNKDGPSEIGKRDRLERIVSLMSQICISIQMTHPCLKWYRQTRNCGEFPLFMLAWKFVEMVYEQGLGKYITHASDTQKWYGRTRNCGEFPLFMRAWKFVDTVYEQELGKCITKSAINWGLKEAIWSTNHSNSEKENLYRRFPNRVE